MACISDNEIVELLEGKLPPERHAELALEVSRCTSCRGLIRDWIGTSVRGTGSRALVPAGSTEAIEVAGYAIGEVLGAGASGVVVRARDLTLDREIALKLFRAEDAYTAALNEARTLALVRSETADPADETSVLLHWFDSHTHSTNLFDNPSCTVSIDAASQTQISASISGTIFDETDSGHPSASFSAKFTADVQ